MPDALPVAIVGAALAALMLAIAISDWRRYRVPDRLSAAALALRMVDIFAFSPVPLLPALLDAAARAAAMACLFYLFRVGYRALRGRDGLGLGDVKLAAVAGAWVDWPLLPAVVEMAALAGLALALFRARSLKLDRSTKLPFAVGFAPAIFVGWQVQHLNL